MIITHKFDMAVDRRGPAPVVDAVQGESNTRFVQISLYTTPDHNKKELWVIPDGVSAMVRFRKKDGTGGIYDILPDGSDAVTLAGNVVTAAIAPQMLTVSGTVLAQIELTTGAKSMATFTFHVEVQPDPSVGTMESKDYYNLSKYVSQEVERILGEGNVSAGSGIHVGPEPPTNGETVWIDTDEAGSGIDVTAEVGQTIVVEEVDASGKPTKWKAADYQPRTHYSEVEENVLLEETVAEFTEENEGFVMLNGTFAAGDTYKVVWNGTEYTGKIVNFADMTVGGNMSFFDENLVGYIEPFALYVMDGVGILLSGELPFTATVCVTIVSETVHKLPVKYASNYIITDVDGTTINESYDNFADILWNGGNVVVKRVVDGTAVFLKIIAYSFNSDTGLWLLYANNFGTNDNFTAANGTWTPPTT